jgi:NADH-quinone oxidoreductase subunit G
MVRFALSSAVNNKKAYVAYMHPVEDDKFKNIVSQFIKYEVGSEEGVLAMICETLLSDESKAKYKAFFDEIDMGYLGGESNVNESELELLKTKMMRKKSPAIIVGEDLISHPRAENIAKLIALLEKEVGFSVLIIPPYTNTLGVSLICDLDLEVGSKSIGYNVKADVTVSADGQGDLDMPALNQQEGTFTNIDKRVVPLNAALPFNGYELNDIAKCLGLDSEHTIEYTKTLPLSAGYQNIEFDNLPNSYSNSGVQNRGYELVCMELESDGELDSVEELQEFNGSVIYSCNPLSQFNTFTNRAHQIVDKPLLSGSEQFAVAAKIKSGDIVTFEFNGIKMVREFKVDSHLKGTVALHSIFDLDSSDVCGAYRYEKVKIQRESN